MILNLFYFAAIVALATAKPFDRDRREPGRAMTWTGWMPGSGMSVFASSQDPWGQQEGLRPPPAMEGGWGGIEHARSHEQEETDKVKPFDEEEDRKPFDDERDRRPVKPTYYKPRKGSDEDEYEDRRSGSNANASFNAWFPIMLGSYPGAESRSKNGGSEKEDDSGRVAAIANSVNHGRSGVASSHAIVYSGQPPNRENGVKKH